jgi:4-hydroxyproline epimerase
MMMDRTFDRIKVIDSHTAGEPTRVVVAGGPELVNGPLRHRLADFAAKCDGFRSSVVNEPRGSDVMVGALLVPPADPSCVAGVIFFNNVGSLGMCGHGTIGVAVVLGHLGRIAAGTHRLETPVGVVAFEYDGRNGVTVENVPAYRQAAAVRVDVPGYGTVTGDVAWGGNWFFLVNEHRETLTPQNVARLTDITCRVRDALAANGVTGRGGQPIDHIELFGPPASPGNHARNFVLCPGNAYDRSPCGTGTSAKLACLYADGVLAPGDVWRQESILGSLFEASIRPVDGAVIARIRGTAHVTAEATLLIDPADPFGRGIPA